MKTIILIVILFVGIFAFWIGIRFALQTEFPLLAVASPSMVPTLNVGDLIVVQGIPNASEVNAAPYPEGDIIVFHKPGPGNELIVHRAVGKEKNDSTWYFQTKGDNNNSYDPWSGQDTWNGMISEKLLVGKVIRIVPWVGHIPLFMRTPSGVLIIVFLFVTLLIIDFVFPRKADKKTESTEEKLLNVYR